MSEIDLIDYLPEELHEYYNKIQNLFPVCLKCQKPVFIKNIIDNKVVKIKIDCEYCQNNQVLTTEEYINQLFSLLPENFNCANHPEKICYGFCQECNKWLCVKCFKDHVADSHTLYLSQFKIRPNCLTHPEEKACFFEKDNGTYLCMKCDFKSKLDKLENNFFNNCKDDGIIGHCFRCLHYEFIGGSAHKIIGSLVCFAADKREESDEETKKLIQEKIDKLRDAKIFLTESIKKVRESNILIANGFLKSLPIYHVFKNIKHNMGENHTAFWAFEDVKSKIEDNEKNMTKELIFELIDQICDICYNHLTTSEHKKLSEENDFDFKDESKIRIKEIACKKFDLDVRAVYLLEENERFLISGSSEFKIYNAKTLEEIQNKKYQSYISYINVVDKKRFIVSERDYYDLYEIQEDGIYKCTKTVTLEKIELEKNAKNEEKKEKKKQKSDSEDSDDDSDEDKNSENDINSNISSIALLKDETKVAIGQGSLITIREFETGKLIKTLKKHEGSVDILFYLKDYLISCCSCNNFCVWDLDTFELKACLDAEINSPNSYLLVDENTMITGGYMIAYKIDLEDLTAEKAFSGDFTLLDGFVKLNGDEIIFATMDGENNTNNIYLYDLDMMDYELQIKNVHNDICQGCISINEKKFISVSRDSTFKVWEIKE